VTPTTEPFKPLFLVKTSAAEASAIGNRLRDKQVIRNAHRKIGKFRNSKIDLKNKPLTIAAPRIL
jgi:hypothetical protein